MNVKYRVMFQCAPLSKVPLLPPRANNLILCTVKYPPGRDRGPSPKRLFAERDLPLSGILCVPEPDCIVPNIGRRASDRSIIGIICWSGVLVSGIWLYTPLWQYPHHAILSNLWPLEGYPSHIADIVSKPATAKAHSSWHGFWARWSDMHATGSMELETYIYIPIVNLHIYRTYIKLGQ
jgi:hypothetical protein